MNKVGSARLSDPTPLTLEEMKQLLPQSTMLGTNYSNRLHLEVAIKTTEAIEKFDRTHYRLGVVMVILTFLLAAMTGVIIWLTCKLLLKG